MSDPPMNERHILIVDDEELYRELLGGRLGRQGYRISEAGDGEGALRCIEAGGVELALIDIKMPGMDGIELLERIKQLAPRTEVVVLTGHGSIDSAIAAMKLGAFDYLTKPYQLTELDLVVARALERSALARRCDALAVEVQRRRSRDDDGMVGDSPAWLQMLEQVRRAAALDVPVLLTGESGAGKEVVAAALHRWSRRAGEAYVPVNCGLLEGELVESELFGHKRGAFTGASADREGLFEAQVFVFDRAALDRGRVGVAVVSLGPRGALVVPRVGGAVWLAAPPVCVRSTTGAGDSMVAGIVAGLAGGQSVAMAARLGVAAGAATVEMGGTQLGERGRIEQLLSLIEETTIDE